MSSQIDALKALEEGLSDSPAGAAGNERYEGSLVEFLETHMATDNGPFTFKGREPLRRITLVLQDALDRNKPALDLSILGAEQWGKTVWANGVTWYLSAVREHNVIYFLPTDNFATNFGRTRVRLMLGRSSYLSSLLATDPGDVNKATIKQFGSHFVRYLGLDTMLGAISNPADDVVYDEVDMLPKANADWSEGRVSASPHRHMIRVSVGYHPQSGIDERYQQGTQHKWFVTCAARRGKKRCGHRFNLEDTFPDCMTLVGENWQRCCPKCKTPVDVETGEWVATHPGRAKKRLYSYRVSALIIAARDPNGIMHLWEKAQKTKRQRAIFDCVVLAKPNAGAMQAITEEDLVRMREVFPLLAKPGQRPRYAGLDMGDWCHLLVGEYDEDGQPRLVWPEVIDVDEVETVVADRIEQLGIYALVVDMNPERRTSRAIAKRFPNKVWLARFDEGKPLNTDEEIHERQKYRVVKIDRNDAIEEFAAEATDNIRPMLIPDKEHLPARQAETMETVERQFMNGRKERTEKGGKTRNRYLKNENHSLLAGAYMRLAHLVGAANMPFTFRAIEKRETGFSAMPRSKKTRSWKGALTRG